MTRAEVDAKLREFPTLEAALERCPFRAQHAKDMPAGYLARAEWAERKAKKHRNVRCEGCARYLVWVPRRRRLRRAA